MGTKDMSAKDVLAAVERNENKRRAFVDSSKFEVQDMELVYKSYDLMKDYIKRLHPGTRGL